MIVSDRPQTDSIIRRMGIAWWVVKATDTHNQAVSLLFGSNFG